MKSNSSIDKALLPVSQGGKKLSKKRPKWSLKSKSDPKKKYFTAWPGGLRGIK